MIDPGRLITAMVTPFDDKGEISRERTSRLVTHLVDSKSSCILVSGTTGESPTVEDNEKLQVLDWVKESVPSGFPVMFGAGTNSTSKSIELAEKAKDHGADILLLVVPYYNKPSQEGIYRHFSALADSVELPCVLYNIPGRTSINMDTATAARLSKNEFIIGVKEASGSLDAVSAISRDAVPDFLVYSGDDSLTLPVCSIGGYGVISVASHVVGKSIFTMMEEFFSGNIKKAAEIHLELFPMFKGLFCTSNPVPVKEALNLMGINVGGVRLPLAECNDSESALLKDLLVKYNLL